MDVEKTMHTKVICALMVALFLAACSGPAQSAVQVDEGWVQEAKVSEISAADLNNSCLCDVQSNTQATHAFMHIQNQSGSADNLIKAESDQVSRIEFRKINQGNALVLEPIDQIALAANGEIVFGPGHYSMILMGIKTDLKPSSHLKIKLTFEKAGEVSADLEIHPR
jgi:copper(I)-binding protein